MKPQDPVSSFSFFFFFSVLPSGTTTPCRRRGGGPAGAGGPVAASVVVPARSGGPGCPPNSRVPAAEAAVSGSSAGRARLGSARVVVGRTTFESGLTHGLWAFSPLPCAGFLPSVSLLTQRRRAPHSGVSLSLLNPYPNTPYLGRLQSGSTSPPCSPSFLLELQGSFAFGSKASAPSLSLVQCSRGSVTWGCRQRLK